MLLPASQGQNLTLTVFMFTIPSSEHRCDCMLCYNSFPRGVFGKSSMALTPNTFELISTLGALPPPGGPVPDPVLTQCGPEPNKLVWSTTTPGGSAKHQSDVERIWHIYDIQGQILALAFRPKPLTPFE